MRERAPSSSRRRWLKLAALPLGLLALALAFREVRFEHVAALLGRLGLLGVLVAFTPQVVGVSLDVLAWRGVFAGLGHRVQYRGLLWVRVATEALALALPGGAVIAEPIKVPLLQRHAKLEVSSAVAGVLARKHLVLSAQASWFWVVALLGLLACWTALSGAPTAGIVAVAFVGAAALGGAGLALRVLFSRGAVATRVRAWLERVPNRTLRLKLAQSQTTFERTDGKLATFFAGPALRRAVPHWLAVASWATESVETFLFLRLVGAELDFVAVACLEVSMTLLRNVAFVLPAGIGVQDLGYALLLRSLGVADATELAAAFALLKRSKELSWVVLGFGLLSSDRKRKQWRLRWCAEARGRFEFEPELLL
jgi:uncharacterized protein (TIRG00374 family)